MRKRTKRDNWTEQRKKRSGGGGGGGRSRRRVNDAIEAAGMRGTNGEHKREGDERERKNNMREMIKSRKKSQTCRQTRGIDVEICYIFSLSHTLPPPTL